MNFTIKILTSGYKQLRPVKRGAVIKMDIGLRLLLRIESNEKNQR